MQLGVGGILAVQIIRTVLESMPNILKANGNGNGDGKVQKSGDMDPAYWHLEVRNAVKEGLAVTAIPVLERQTQILEDIKELQKELLRQTLRRHDL